MGIEPEKYKNVIPYIKLTSTEIAEQASMQKLRFSNIRNDFVEWKLDLPMFARPFYAYIYLNNKTPTQEEFFQYYINKNNNYFYKNRFSEDIMDAIQARAFRIMPSLVRDIHFNKYISENIEGYNTLYSLELDIKDGIDLLLYNKNNIYAVNLYTNTKRAFDGRLAKKNRHILFDNVMYIEFPVELTSSHKHGDYFLYGKYEYNKLLKLIES